MVDLLVSPYPSPSPQSKCPSQGAPVQLHYDCQHCRLPVPHSQEAGSRAELLRCCKDVRVYYYTIVYTCMHVHVHTCISCSCSTFSVQDVHMYMDIMYMYSVHVLSNFKFNLHLTLSPLPTGEWRRLWVRTRQGTGWRLWSCTIKCSHLSVWGWGR